MSEQEIGVVGLATMGMNLSRNLASHGARVAVYNRTRKRTDDFMSQHGSEGDFRAAGSLGELVRILKPPRAILRIYAARLAALLLAYVAIAVAMGLLSPLNRDDNVVQ